MLASLPVNQAMLAVLKPVRSGLIALAALAGAAMVTGSIALGAGTKPAFRLAKPQSITIAARPIATFSKAGGTAARGQLVWRGGLVLTAEAEQFGGYSGLIVSADGRDLLAVSDAGGWLKARIDYDGARPTAISNATIGSLLARDGNPIRRLRERDAEGLALATGTLDKGQLLIAFENINRIARYAVAGGAPGRPLEVIEPPPGLSRFSRDGMEAMTVLQGGRYKGRMVAFSENAGGDGRHAGWIWAGGKPKPLNVVSRGGFALTAAASLADGTLLLLERRFTLLEGVRMRLRRIAPADVKPGSLLEGETLIEADMADEIDNMEGLAVHTAANGDAVLTLISDDNFNRSIQRTLLLQFTLPSRAGS